jgi:hypothetical protein
MILAICLSIIYSAVLAGSSERMKRFIIVVSCRVVSCRVASCRVCSIDDIYRIRKRISIYSLMMGSVGDCGAYDINKKYCVIS